MREQLNDGASAPGTVRSVPVLMYHEITDPRMAAWRDLAVSPAAFKQQLEYLRSAGYETITAGALATLVASGGPISPRTIVLTFDDGFADFYQCAIPTLANYGFNATVFVTTGWVQDADTSSFAGRPGQMLNWSQIAESVAAGMEVAAHTCQHPQLDRISRALLREELYTSKSSLEDRLGIPMPGLAYPYGYSNAEVRQVAREAGYEYGYAVRNMMTSLGPDSFRLPRLTVHRSTTLSEFRRLVAGQFALTMVRDRAFTAAWSVVRRSRAALTIGRRA